MRLKPKSTVHNPRALLYKRFTDLETSIAKDRAVLYHTEDNKYFIFVANLLNFEEVSREEYPNITPIEAGGATFERAFSYKGAYFIYHISNGIGYWEMFDTAEETGNTAQIGFSVEENERFDIRQSIGGLYLPQTFPQTITYTDTKNVYGFTMQVVDRNGHYANYIANEPNVLTKTGEGITENKALWNTIQINGNAVVHYSITTNVINGEADESNSQEIIIGEEVTLSFYPNSGYYSPFQIPTVIGADIALYECHSDGAYLIIENSIEDVIVDIVFTNNVVLMAHNSQFIVGWGLTATYISSDLVERSVDIASEGYLDANEALSYTIDVDEEIKDRFAFDFTGSYRGTMYTNEPLTINASNKLLSPSGEENWQFTSDDIGVSKQISDTYIGDVL